jgi:hypothetical protein
VIEEVAIVLAVLILLGVLSFLPENLKEEYTLRGDLEYTISHPITLLSAHYLHWDAEHLRNNAVNFGVVNVGPLIIHLSLSLIGNQTKIERGKLIKSSLLVHLFNLIVIPVLISVVEILFVPFTEFRGFSGVVFAYLGYCCSLPLTTTLLNLKLLNLKVGSLLLLIVSVPFVFVCILFLKGLLPAVLVFILLILVFILPYLICSALYRGTRKALVVASIFLIILLFLVCNPIPTDIYREGKRIDTTAHLLGLYFGFLGSFVIFTNSFTKLTVSTKRQTKS